MTPPTPCHPDSNRFLRNLLIGGVGALLVLGIVRAILCLGIAAFEIPASDQPFRLEGASVHFAWRAQHDLPLYPPQEETAYSVNYMGPCYFWTVGRIGRLLNADIATLYLIGRAITFLCGLGPAIIAAFYLRRRYGRWAALAGLIFGLGSGPMIAFGVVSRPDMMADALGVAGFFLACRTDRRWLPAAAVLLALACLTKQTAGVWLLAAVIVLFFHQGAARRAIFLGGVAATVVLSVIALLGATCEPYIWSSLFSQLGLPFDPQQQLGILVLLLRRSPEMLFFVLVGCGLWMSSEYKDRVLFIATSLWMLAIIVACAKRGSDLNYFIPLRIIEALAAGTLCAGALRSGRHRLGWTLLTFAGIVAMLPGTLFAAETALTAMRHREHLESADGLAERQQFQHYAQLAADDGVRLLTDSDRLAVYQGCRAPFFDCYLFRLQADAGRIDARELVDRLQSRWYEYVILSADVSVAHHDYFFYDLPESVAEAVKANYTLQSQEAGLYVYVPRKIGVGKAD